MRDGDESPRDPDHAAILEINRLIAGKHGLEASIDQEGAEHDDSPIESLDQGETGKNKDAPQDQRAQNAPKKHAHLECRRNLEVAQNDNKNEDVVHAQRIFDEVPGQELDGLFMPELEVDPGVERKGERDVAGRRPKCLADRDLSCLAVEDAEIGCEDGEYENVESNPCKGGVLFKHRDHRKTLHIRSRPPIRDNAAASLVVAAGGPEPAYNAAAPTRGLHPSQHLGQ